MNRSTEPPTLGRLLASGTARLSEVTDTPRLDAEWLLAHALGTTRGQLLGRLNEPSPPTLFDKLLDRRAKWEPLAYVLGEWEFFSLPFFVEAPVLVPRPETEHLVEATLTFLPESAASTVCELGVGSGCVSVTIAKHRTEIRITGVDIRPANIELARRNAERHRVLDRLELREGDLFAALRPGDGPFDAIVSNPPYVEDSAWVELTPSIREYEDPVALLAGPDGLSVVRRIVDEAPAHLKPGGLLALELGLGQYEAVSEMLRAAGFVEIGCIRDLAGIQRIITARRST